MSKFSWFLARKSVWFCNWPVNLSYIRGGDWKRGSIFYNDPPQRLEKGGQYSTSVWKVCKKRGSKIYNSKKYRGQNSTTPGGPERRGKKSRIRKKYLFEVWKWGSKFYILKNRGQNSTMFEKRGVNILHPTPKVEVKLLHRLKKGGQKGRAYPLSKI